MNPAAAARLEVVRGPATLLHGASAIGGLVNVITDVIPTEPLSGAKGTFTLDAGSAASEAGGAADLHWGNGSFALHLGGSGRRSGDVDTPEGDIENTQSRSGFGNIGVGWTGAKGYFGASYGYDDTKYGIPFVEEGQVQLTPRRHLFNVRGERRDMTGFVSGVRASVGVRRYRHDELVGDEVGTRFRNNTFEFELLANHRQAGRVKGTWGGVGQHAGVRGHRRGSPRAAHRSNGSGRVLLRGSDLAPRDVPVRRPRGACGFRAGRGSTLA